MKQIVSLLNPITNNMTGHSGGMRQIQDSPSGYLSENYNYMKLLKRTAFSLLGILLLILTIATILEKNIWYGLCKRVYLQFRTFCHFMGE